MQIKVKMKLYRNVSGVALATVALALFRAASCLAAQAADFVPPTHDGRGIQAAIDANVSITGRGIHPPAKYLRRYRAFGPLMDAVRRNE